MSEQSGAVQAQERVFGTERAKAFIDAVVAIAITLLILPLMESLTDFADTGRPALDWFSEHAQQLISFVSSFWVIAAFWVMHHQIYQSVRAFTLRLLWILMGWLMTIVWLPVATAMMGQLETGSGPVLVIYAASCALTAFLGVWQLAYLNRHPALHDIPATRLRRYLAVGYALMLLNVVSMLAMVLFPGLGALPMFLLGLTAPLSAVLARRHRGENE